MEVDARGLVVRCSLFVMCSNLVLLSVRSEFVVRSYVLRSELAVSPKEV